MLSTKLCNKFIALLSSLLIVTGCSQAPASFNIRETQSDSTAAVYIYRPDTMANLMVSPDIIVDGVRQFSINNKQYQTLQLTAGTHQIQLALTERYQGEHNIILDMAAGQAYFLRVDTAMKFQQNRPYDRSFDIRLVTEADALSQIALCKPATADHTKPVTEAPVEKTPGYSNQTFRNPFSH